MKKWLTLCLAMLVATAGGWAQRADIRKMVERYYKATTLMADVTQTRHNEALTADAVTKGYFYYRKPNCQSMVFKEAAEMLLATEDTYTMIRNGKQHVAKAKGKGGNPFEVVRDVFRNLLSADDDARLTDMADVTLQTQGHICTITLTPVVADAKAKRRAMFTSCVVTIDLKAVELRSLCIYEQRGNYTRYDFSNYLFNIEIDPSVFDIRSVL